ncbi:MAG: hypothetical protein NT075_31360 [Chloroflexi bacterium]|nr:hypothetical protein [Chloroflexota bacterium]
MKKQAVFIILTRLMALVMLTACQYAIVTPVSPLPIAAEPPTIEGEIRIPFETITLDDVGVNFDLSRRKPQLFLLASKNDIPQISGLISQAVLTQLQQIDFSHYLVVALFREVEGSSNFQVIIRHITKKDDQLTIEAQFWEPGAHIITQSIETSPYHLVQISRTNLSPADVKLILHSYVVVYEPYGEPK